MRLKYTTTRPTHPDPRIQSWMDKLIGNADYSTVNPLYRTLLHSPAFAFGFTQFFRAIRWQTTLPADLMELAMCRVGALNSAAFEWMHHAPLLAEAGVGPDGVETVRSASAGAAGPGRGLTANQWAVLRYVDAMTREIAVPDDVFAGALAVLGGNEQQMIELTLTIAGYNAVSRFLVATDVAELKDVPVGKAKL